LGIDAPFLLYKIGF